jgi:hypothetical protein
MSALDCSPWRLANVSSTRTLQVLRTPVEVAQAHLEADIERQRRQDRMTAAGHIVASEDEQQRTFEDTITMIEWDR